MYGDEILMILSIKIYYTTDDNNFDKDTLHTSDIRDTIRIKLLKVAAVLLLLITFD